MLEREEIDVALSDLSLTYLRAMVSTSTLLEVITFEVVKIRPPSCVKGVRWGKNPNDSSRWADPEMKVFLNFPK